MMLITERKCVVSVDHSTRNIIFNKTVRPIRVISPLLASTLLYPVTVAFCALAQVFMLIGMGAFKMNKFALSIRSPTVEGFNESELNELKKLHVIRLKEFGNLQQKTVDRLFKDFEPSLAQEEKERSCSEGYLKLIGKIKEDPFYQPNASDRGLNQRFVALRKLERIRKEIDAYESASPAEVKKMALMTHAFEMIKCDLMYQHLKHHFINMLKCQIPVAGLLICASSEQTLDKALDSALLKSYRNHIGETEWLAPLFEMRKSSI